MWIWPYYIYYLAIMKINKNPLLSGRQSMLSTGHAICEVKSFCEVDFRILKQFQRVDSQENWNTNSTAKKKVISADENKEIN